MIGKGFQHLLGALEICLRAVKLQAVLVIQLLASLNTDNYIVEKGMSRLHIVIIISDNERYSGVAAEPH